MALLVPEQPKDCAYGERLVYERFGRELDKDWVVLHSLGLHGHETKLWGEADIVVLSTKGFFALEVKGGRVSCLDGVWHYGDPATTGYTRREDPWTQSQGTMRAIQKLLEGADASFKGLLMGFGVVMPMETFTTTGAEIEQAVLLDKREFAAHAGYYIGRLQRHWTGTYEGKHGRSPRLPTRDEILKARAVLRPNINSTYSLGSWLTGVESRQVELTNEQVRASRRMAANPRTVVRGKAGTGKSIIATTRARELAATGNRVLYLCFNQLLAQHQRDALAQHDPHRRIEVRHIHALFREVISQAGFADRLSAAPDDTKLFSELMPRVFVDAALEIDLKGWDALVIDEAQDLLTPPNLEALDLMLGAKGLNRGRWHMFLDPQQNIYEREMQESCDQRLDEASPTFDDLWENCRNTRQVAVQASIVSGIDLALEGAPEGPACENCYYPSRTKFFDVLEATVAQLLDGEIMPNELIVLSTRKQQSSLVAGTVSVAGRALRDVSVAKPDEIAFATMHAFKGLERKVVLAIDMEDIGATGSSMLHYAGLSRARSLLRVFLPGSAKPTYARQAAAFAERLRT